MSVAFPSDHEMRIRRRGGDWITIPLQHPLTVQQVASFPQKVTIGEPNKGSHPLLSTWGFDGLPGGSGVAKHDNTTTRRYKYAIADTRNATFFAAPRKTLVTTGTANPFMPHNDLVVSGVRRLYGTFGVDLHIWNESTLTWTDTTNNLSAAAVNPGVAFQGTGTLRLFIPMGSTGYARWDGTTLTNVAASGSQPAARDFVVLGTMLVCLDVSNQLWWSIDGSTWTSFGTAGKLEAGVSGRRTKIYKNAYGDKTVHIATDNGLYAFDPAGPTMYDTDLALPPHPYQGYAMDRWRDQLFISGGMGVMSWNGAAVNEMGLDRNHGLPNFDRGWITDLVGARNGLFALVRGYDPVTTFGMLSVHEWTGEGWQCHWRNEMEPTSTFKMVVSSAQGGYRVWWGYGNSACGLPIPVDGANAEQLAELLDGEFEKPWFLDTGLNAFDMEGFTKIAVAAEWDEYINEDGALDVYAYYSDQTVPATELQAAVAGVSATGEWKHRSVQFGYDAVTGAYLGTPFDQIGFQFIGQPKTYDGPEIVKNFVFTFQKVVEGYRAWSTTVNLQRYYDQGMGDIADLINDLVLANEYCLLQYQQEQIRVRFASWSGVDDSGQAHQSGMRRISIIEIPVSP
jgi:hypothetical protein